MPKPSVTNSGMDDDKNQGWPHWTQEVTDVLEAIPVVGPFIAVVIIMIATLAYWFLLITLYCFILIPYSAVRGIINPNIPMWKFLFGDTRSFRSPSRLDFVVLLAVYALMYGAVAYLLLVAKA